MTREEALKIVRENYPHFGTTEPWLDLEKALATLIPELRESEDERIRKVIIKHFEEIANRNEQSWINLDIPYILAYLEKQKESLHIPETCKENADSFPDLKRSSDYPKEGCNVSLNGEIKKIQEWNEEDEEIKRCICLALTDANEQRFKDFGTTLKDCLAWVKSRRPRWRPSEEQMEAFKSYIGDFQERAEAAVGGWNNFDVMIRLFEQLKKLM